jgi:beta-N-acetylhexosaminidase
MTAHVGLPSLTGRADLPATLSPDIMQGILRQEMGFKGLLISDALDMKAITQGAGQLIDVVAALRAGVDLLLLTGDPEVQERIYTGLKLAYSRGLLRDEHLEGTLQRLASLRTWLSGRSQPGLEVIGSAEHHRLSETVARRSITLVKDEASLLPLNLEADERIAAIMPRPADLTPADTSSYVEPALARSLRSFHPNVDEFIVPQQPSSVDIAALKARLDQYDLLVIGTTSAQMQPAQATMVNELLNLALPTVTVAMRTPYDITVFPQASTYVCTYSIQPVAMQALANALWGAGPFEGQLPVRLSL